MCARCPVHCRPCVPIPQTAMARFRDVSVWELAGLLLLRRFSTRSRRCREMMMLPFGSFQVFSLSLFLLDFAGLFSGIDGLLHVPFPRVPCIDSASVLDLVGRLLVVLRRASSVLSLLPRWCFRAGAARGSSPCRCSTWIFSTLPCSSDDAFVPELLVGLLLVAFPRRSDTDMLRSPLLSWKTVMRSHTRQNATNLLKARRFKGS